MKCYIFVLSDGTINISDGASKLITYIAKPFRENLGKLICFYNPKKKDMKNLFDDYLGEVSKGEQKKIWQKLKKT